MTFLRTLKYFSESFAPLVFFSLLSVYFLWHWEHGEKGRQTYHEKRLIEREALKALDSAKKEEAVWQRRVDGLGYQALDKDLLDERARLMLNDSAPEDIIVPLPKSS